MSRGAPSSGAGISLTVLLALPAAAQADDFTVTNKNDDGAGSLRDAVDDANSDPAADRILFKAKLSGAITLSGGELYIDTPIEIRGPGARELTVSAGGSSRIFRILTPVGTDVEISGLTLAGGDATGGSGQGGAIYVTHTDFTLSQATVTGNSALIGGGIYAYESNAVIVNSTIADNRAVGPPSGDGGGVFSFDDITIESSTISGNTADAQGGGVGLVAGPLVLHNSTIAANQAGSEGGGIFNGQADAELAGSIVADNNAALGNDLYEGLPMVSSFGGSFNLIEDLGNVSAFGSNNVFGQDPNLKPLRNNGGPTNTHAFKKSPAKNKIPKSETPKSDQRGAKRKGKGDIGAYELVKCEGVIVNRVGTAKKDKLKGTKKADGILGLGGNDKLSGKKGKDGLCGGKGKDKLKGGPGKDKLDGGPGKDKEIQ